MSFGAAIWGFLKGQTSQAELDHYRRATASIEDLEVAVKTQILDRPLPAGGGPWQRPRHHHHALLFTSIARDFATIAASLLESDAAQDPATAGYVPLVTFEQVKSLYQQLPDLTRRAWEALANPRYVSDLPLPIALGPRAEARGKCPLVHLRGMYAAAAALDAIDKARIEAYLGLVKSSGVVPPDEVKHALGQLTQLWAGAQADFAFTRQQLALVSDGNVPVATHEEAEDRLWDSLVDHVLVGQFVAMPELVADAGPFPAGRRVAESDRWFLTDPKAASELQGTQFGEQEMRYFWREKRWRTTPREERYLTECARLLERGAIAVASRWSTCPFSPAYISRDTVTVLGVPIAAGHEFYLVMDDDEDKLIIGTPLFRRASGYQEEHEGGHD
jgi:hypothetical protein